MSLLLILLLTALASIFGTLAVQNYKEDEKSLTKALDDLSEPNDNRKTIIYWVLTSLFVIAIIFLFIYG